VFLAVLDQAYFDAGLVFIVDGDAPAEMLPFDLDWGHMPLASEMVAAAISLGFFSVDGMGNPEAYLSCDEFRPEPPEMQDRYQEPSPDLDAPPGAGVFSETKSPSRADLAMWLSRYVELRHGQELAL